MLTGLQPGLYCSPVPELQMRQKIMRAIYLLPSVLFTLCLLAMPVVYATDAENAAAATIEVGAAQNYLRTHEDAIIIDVRTPAEYELSHITNALNVNVQDDAFAEMAAGLDPDKTYIVHCTKNPAGGRSSRALETLRGLGFKNLYSLEGGYVAWKDAKLPLSAAEH